MAKQDKQQYQGFNPIKETVDGKRAHSVIWTSRSLGMAIDGLNQGKKLIANPFYENNTKILKGDLVFQRTPEEEQEFIRCMNDIVYFANEYCKLMTPEGIKKVEMRDYQRDYLEHLTKHQLSIFLSCRQSGKCIFFNTNVYVRFDTSKIDISRRFNKFYDSETDSYCVPVYEIYNLSLRNRGKMTLRWRIEYLLYRFLRHLM